MFSMFCFREKREDELFVLHHSNHSIQPKIDYFEPLKLSYSKKAVGQIKMCVTKRFQVPHANIFNLLKLIQNNQHWIYLTFKSDSISK